MTSNEVQLWCPHCGRHKAFRPSGPAAAGPLGGRRRAACTSCGGVWLFGTGRGRRTVCESWEEPPAALPRAGESDRPVEELIEELWPEPAEE